jgi:uncharacterized protein
MAHRTVGRISNPSRLPGRIGNPSYSRVGHARANRSKQTCCKASGGVDFAEGRVKGSTKQSRRKTGRPDKETLAEIVCRVVEVAQPDKIVLFGSAARGEMGPHSDIDLLVIKAGKFHRGRLATAIYRNLSGANAAVDVIIVTPEEVERYRNTPCLVICPALREGKVVHGA